MSYVAHFAASLLLWVLLVWPFDPAPGRLLAAGAGQDLAAGAAVAALCAAALGRGFPRDTGKLLDPLRWLFGAWLGAVLLWNCLAAGLDLARRVVHLRLPVSPAIVRVRTTVRSEVGRSALAWALGLAPGTMAVDVVGQYLYVHWMDALTESPELRAELIVGRFEGLVKRVFD